MIQFSLLKMSQKSKLSEKLMGRKYKKIQVKKYNKVFTKKEIEEQLIFHKVENKGINKKMYTVEEQKKQVKKFFYEQEKIHINSICSILYRDVLLDNINETQLLQIKNRMQGNFQKSSQIFQNSNYQDIEHQSFQSHIQILKFENFLLNSQNNPLNDQQADLIKEISGEKTIEEQQQPLIGQDEKQQKQKKRKPNITPETRLSNYIFPNIVREVKHCLHNSFQAENKCLHSLLLEIFKQLKINYQVWAYDAILLILIYLRDKTDLLTHKKFSAVIDHVSSTLSKFLAKFVSRPYSKEQIKYLNNQYRNCIEHLKIYDDPKNTFETLSGEKGKSLKQEFFMRVLLTRRRQKIRLLHSIGIVQQALIQGLVEKTIRTQSKEKELRKQEKEKAEERKDKQ